MRNEGGRQPGRPLHLTGDFQEAPEARRGLEVQEVLEGQRVPLHRPDLLDQQDLAALEALGGPGVP
jgi:hypothetical protein